MPPFVCTLGDLMLDVVVLPTAPLSPDGDTPATIRLTAGGQAANVAAWASSLGARSRLICARGSDQASQIAAEQLQGYGVELCGPQFDGAGGVVVSTREPDGSRTMASDPGAAARLSPGDLDPAWFADVTVLHISGYSLLRESVAQTAIAAAELAPWVTLDLSSAADIERFGADRFQELVRALAPDLIFANEAEHAALADLTSGPELQLELGWVIKHGAGGATFPEGHLAAAAARVLDVTGAGDALAAGYLVGGPGLAMTAAALCVECVGAMPGLYMRP